jgi:hypothetical protein
VARRKAELEEQERRAEERVRQNAVLQSNIKLAAEKLPPPPEDGVAIQFVLPGGTKLERKFGVNQPVDDLYTFIAARDECFDEEGAPVSFMLTCVRVLDKGKTLAEAGIKSRSQLLVALD